MILSKVEFNPSALRNPYEWHKILWDHFPGRENNNRDFLFRIEGYNLDGKTLVLLQSKTFPEAIGKQSSIKESSKLIESTMVAQDRVYRFKITANAIKSIKDRENPERKIRVPLIKQEEQINWLKRKFDGAGEILNVIVNPNPPIYFKKGGANGKLVAITFEGFIKVINSDSMFELMRQGIGPAKAFGCGLITLGRS